ncbi:hypothetical protein WICANDRAFT_76362 [Wickerhamomyces anomalus NRRL Y-366-8]|uniref:Cysteine protease RIM13 n=1 Tax=Wickerhamomyces anomalus (strain ATCC 58044 / CBS 1984 / NCYC 433 / NRRL Y-366-8) TaxID=683960 RepID=A0A1E3PAD2_WICAA|nr:uncharacterized protein WICANDRAFT_76362 [Wickerhamomyces anomalus NRRL Y-366-8]ODQ62184.1 hypothetical protein WICANDRAFT_76362 [Wickerhamomyces anomalus NRRL Y-366-8]
MEQDNVPKALRILERAKYQYALGATANAKKLGIEAINLLNSVLKDGAHDKVILKEICNDAIEFYQNISNSKYLTFDEKLTWLSSSVNGGFFPPAILKHSFIADEELNDELHLSEDQTAKLTSWKSINNDNDWSLDGIDHLYQDYLQDCSFVASLISLSKFNSKLLLNTIYPHKSSKRYGVTLHFNGCQRLVEIGDQLPVLSKECLYIKSRSNEHLLWVSLIEKAYLKVQGHGYEAKGSNASIDTYVVSGWIPQFIHADQRVDLNSLWEDLYDSFQNNRLVLSLGTGKHSEYYYPNHDYSILELVESTRSIVIKNPWEESIRAVKFEELFDHFETLYINWNPSNFIHTQMNFIWTYNDDIFFNNPQFSVTNDNPATVEVWILIEKFMGFEQSSINVLVYQSNGQKLFSKGKSLVYNSSNNSGFHLSKFKLGAGQSATIVVTNDSKQTQNFSIHAYSSKRVSLTKAKAQYPFLKSIKDEWDVDSCGGNWSHQSYVKNPQYQIEVPEAGQDVEVIFGLFSNKDVLLNLQLYWDDDKPFSEKASLIHEKYHAGSMTKCIKLKSGQKYKLVMSTYDTDILAPFRLLINSNVGLSIQKLSSRLGLFLRTFKFDWNNKNRFKLKFQVKRETPVKVHIWTDNLYSSYRPKIRASLFYSDGRPIQINTEFDDSIYGIWLKKAIISPTDSVILLIERFEVGNDEMSIEIGSDQKIEVLT